MTSFKYEFDFWLRYQEKFVSYPSHFSKNRQELSSWKLFKYKSPTDFGAICLYFYEELYQSIIFTHLKNIYYMFWYIACWAHLFSYLYRYSEFLGAICPMKLCVVLLFKKICLTWELPENSPQVWQITS